MRIEDDDNKTSSRMDTIRHIQEYQAEQARMDQAAEQQRLDAQRVDTTQDPNEIDASMVAQQDMDAQMLRGEADRQTVEGIEEKSGMQRSDDATQQASAQQDRAEQWQSFAADDSKAEIPPSVEDLRNEDQAAEQRQEQERINMRELLNQMTIQSGQIKS